MALSQFVRLVHSDWSINPNKRWAVEACRTEAGWSVEAPRRVGRPIEHFVTHLVRGNQPTLAGFDFPIGAPAIFGRMTEFSGFTEALEQFGVGSWSRFFHVAERPEDVSLHRPFYPYRSSAMARQAHLLAGLSAENIDELRRQCEHASGDRKAACPLFWTLGANQVGKAAISGWLEVVKPALRLGALLWPFEGDLSLLAEAGKLVICETYPAEAYGHVGVRFRVGGSKQRTEDRRDATAELANRCNKNNITLTPAMKDVLTAGFGLGKSGEDPFDATIGLLGMIEVVEGGRTEAPEAIPAREWEGWILGQAK